MMWDRGASVVVRSRPLGEVSYTFPAIVVRDSPDLVALFQPPGTRCKRRSGVRGGPNGRNMVTWDGSYVDVVTDSSTIHAWVPDDAFWVIRDWTGAEYEGWYINLAEPWKRTAIGFDMADQILDVVVEPDRSSWRWKDEDELAWAVQHGRYAPEVADQIRRHAHEALARMATALPPFHEGWSDLEPDGAWPMPVLPAGWELIDEKEAERRSTYDAKPTRSRR